MSLVKKLLQKVAAVAISRILDWINENPFRSTQLIYEPGPQVGTTDVTLVTKDRFPLRIYGGHQNTGNIMVT